MAALGGPAAFKILAKLSRKFRKVCNSFTGDTLVDTEFGLVPISEIEIGDKVWAYDEETGETSLHEVVHTIEGEGDNELIELMAGSGEIIRTTEAHPFYANVEGVWQWVFAQDIHAGFVIQDEQGQSHNIIGAEIKQRQGKVYNLTVNNAHTFLVGTDKLIAHNAGPCKIPVFNTRATNHIRGEFNAAGKLVGYHSRYGGIDRSGIRVIDIVRAKGGNKNKIYKGTVQVFKDGEWVNKKGGISTFWPDGWDIRRIQKEVNAAYIKAIGQGFKGNSEIIVKGPSGFKVLIQAENGVIIRTHPVL